MAVLFNYMACKLLSIYGNTQYTMTQCDVTRCIICICNKSEYLDKERSYKNSTKEVILRFQVIFAMQSRKYWTKFRFIGTLKQMYLFIQALERL